MAVSKGPNGALEAVASDSKRLWFDAAGLELLGLAAAVSARSMPQGRRPDWKHNKITRAAAE
jgi:hypothetical protein